MVGCAAEEELEWSNGETGDRPEVRLRSEQRSPSKLKKEKKQRSLKGSKRTFSFLEYMVKNDKNILEFSKFYTLSIGAMA